MKRLLTSTALIVATAGFAHAAAHMDANMIRGQVEDYFATSTMMVDTSSLTDEQIAELHLAITSSDTAGERQAGVEAVLNDMNVEMMGERSADVTIATPRDQVYTRVSEYLDGTMWEGQAASLTDAQLSQLYLTATSTDSATEKNAAIDAIMN